MSTASDVKCGIVYDTNTGEIRRVVNADSKVSMLRGVGTLGKNETLLRVERKEYSKLASSEEVKDYVTTERTKKTFLITPELLQNKKERIRKSIGVVFSEETGEVLRIVRADNDVRMFFGASLQEKERLVKLTNKDFEDMDDEAFKSVSVVEKIKKLIMKNKLDYKSLSFDEYYTWMLKNSMKYLVG